MRTIHPLIGVDDLRFGMRPSEVRASLGESQQYEDWMGGNLEDFLFYKGILVGFAGNNGAKPVETSRLVIIELSGNQPLKLFESSIEASSKAHVAHVLAGHAARYREVSSTVTAAVELGLTFTFSDHGTLLRVSVQVIAEHSDA